MENSGGVGRGMDMASHASGDLDNLSNLLINSYEDDAAALDAYELEMERNLQENLLLEKEHHNQRLFQSFQKSACNVAQMFKDKGSPQQAQAVLSSWESFQNAAGAITVLYKESLEACRVHMELGVHLGQQRKLKDIISWVKKKKKRSIRKDELVSFLIGKQYPSQNQMFSLFGSQASNPFNVMSSGDSSGPSMFAGHRHGRAQQLRQQQQQQRNTLISTSSGNSSISGGQTSNNTANSVNSMLAGSCQAPNQPQLNAAAQLNLIGGNDNSNGSEVETNSDLATFREALIMHNRSRDTPPTFSHAPSSNSHHAHHHHAPSHHHHHQTSHSHGNASAAPNDAAPPNCDDLDCFFCEQIATHIEHRKRSSAAHFDMDSPTRKRGRFY